jgi:hypothetical protein
MATETAARRVNPPTRRRNTTEESRPPRENIATGSTFTNWVPIGTRIYYLCPLCNGGNADARREDRRDGGTWFIGCKSAGCDGSRTYVPDLAVALGLDRWASGDRIVGVLRSLRPGGVRRPGGRPSALPSSPDLAEWAARLIYRHAARRYLVEERGLTTETYRAAGIGYAPYGTGLHPWPQVPAFVIPVFRDGALVNVRRRFWPDAPTSAKGKPVKIAGLRGRPTELYPDVPAGTGPLLLCEGEFDALIARQHGLPAFTSTGGTGWKPEWDAVVVGRRVAVVYDAGEAPYAIARKRAAALREAGAASAWAVDLAALGLDDGEDLTDWFVTHGRTAGELRRELNRSRRRSA